MKTHAFETLTIEQLTSANGGIDPAASWIMQHESGGSATAGHLYAQGRGDGTPGNHSSAFGAFQMTQATRRQYMGADYQSTDFNKQYAAATRYVNQRYGSWARPRRSGRATLVLETRRRLLEDVQHGLHAVRHVQLVLVVDPDDLEVGELLLLDQLQ